MIEEVAFDLAIGKFAHFSIVASRHFSRNGCYDMGNRFRHQTIKLHGALKTNIGWGSQAVRDIKNIRQIRFVFFKSFPMNIKIPFKSDERALFKIGIGRVTGEAKSFYCRL